MPAFSPNLLRINMALVVVLLGGCGNELANLSDSDLQDRSHECRTNTEPTPGQAISCDNFRRECRRRRDEGRYVC